MDGQQVIENLDALWFFGTVFSHRTTPSAIQKLENYTLNNVEEPSGEEIATPIHENQENESPIGGNLVQKTFEDGGFASEIKTEVEAPSKATEKEEKRRRSSRRSCPISHRRKVLGEMDLSFAVKEVCECWLLEQRSGGHRRIGVENQKKMPPFEDSIAMKEHIRSWAYAVACTVR